MENTTSIEMYKLMEQWENSGKNQKDFLRENNIGIHKFYYWLKKYRDQKTPGGFAPLKVTKGKQRSIQIGYGIEIHYSNGTVIHLPSTTTLSVIRQLIRM
jgi:hypothetical protein